MQLVQPHHVLHLLHHRRRRRRVVVHGHHQRVHHLHLRRRARRRSRRGSLRRRLRSRRHTAAEATAATEAAAVTAAVTTAVTVLLQRHTTVVTTVTVLTTDGGSHGHLRESHAERSGPSHGRHAGVGMAVRRVSWVRGMRSSGGGLLLVLLELLVVRLVRLVRLVVLVVLVRRLLLSLVLLLLLLRLVLVVLRLLLLLRSRGGEWRRGRPRRLGPPQHPAAASVVTPVPVIVPVGITVHRAAVLARRRRGEGALQRVRRVRVQQALRGVVAVVGLRRVLLHKQRRRRRLPALVRVVLPRRHGRRHGRSTSAHGVKPRTRRWHRRLEQRGAHCSVGRRRAEPPRHRHARGGSSQAGGMAHAKRLGGLRQRRPANVADRHRWRRRRRRCLALPLAWAGKVMVHRLLPLLLLLLLLLRRRGVAPEAVVLQRAAKRRQDGEVQRHLLEDPRRFGERVGVLQAQQVPLQGVAVQVAFESKGLKLVSHFMVSRVETRRFQAMMPSAVCCNYFSVTVSQF
jgi:hypothetical protein